MPSFSASDSRCTVVPSRHDTVAADARGWVQREGLAAAPDMSDHRLGPVGCDDASCTRELGRAAAGPDRLVLHIDSPINVVERFPFSDDLACRTVTEKNLTVAFASAAFLIMGQHRASLPAKRFRLV